MLQLLTLLFQNPVTGIPGAALFFTNLGAVFTLLGSGAPLTQILNDPHLQALVTGIGLIFAKDFNVTGGTKAQ